MCNTIEKQSCVVTSHSGKRALVFAPGVLEDFQMIREAVNYQFLEEYIENLYYLLNVQMHLAKGEYGATLHYVSKCSNTVQNVIEVLSMVVSETEENQLFIQQFFLIGHEIDHYWISFDPIRKEQAIHAKGQFLKKSVNTMEKGEISPILLR